MSEPEPSISLAAAVVPLLKGVVYADSNERAWEALLEFPAAVRDYVRVMGLEPVIDEAEGYAFLRSLPADDSEEAFPRLIARRSLTYTVSLMLAMLRRRMLEFDAQGDQVRLVLGREEIVDLVRVHHPSAQREAKLVDDVERDLNKLIDMGFVRRMRSEHGEGADPSKFEVRRIIKAFVTAEWLASFNDMLEGAVAQRQEATP